MKVVLLDGTPQDKQALVENWKNPDAVFLLRSEELKLYEYIDKFIKKSDVLYRIRICYELTGLDVDYCEVENPDADFAQNIGAVESCHAETLSELLSLVNPAKTSYVTVNGDIGADEKKIKATRAQLGEIVQQMIYLQLPLHKIRVRTAKEMKTAESVRVFEKRLGELREETRRALLKMERDKGAFYDSVLWEGVYGSLSRIFDYLSQSAQDEMKIAVAATKKTGKSVIVNSIIEQELAPTSLEQATPNNCVYRRREDQYSLQSEGGKLRGFGAGKEGAAGLRSELTKEFKQAQKSEGIAIPDMNIGYMSKARGISSYVITDTPGPDREGHEGAEEIARKAVRGADMAIYAIDYSKHLTKDEAAYLKWIVDEFNKNGKYYSLIFDVNRMDTRYQDKGHKSVPRSLDFIRNELIKIDSSFQSCILFGTSALTYFYALAAAQIPGCETLAEQGGLSELPELLEKYKEDDDIFGEEDAAGDDADPKTVLNFLDESVSRLKRFHSIQARSLEDLKQFSGMQSLLSYVGYVAREKARTEKLNSLMHKIDREYADIVNLFHFQELQDALAKNRDRLEEIQKLLSEFAGEVGKIDDKDFPEVYQRCKAGEVKSDWIREYGQRYPFHWEDVAKAVIGDLKARLEIRSLLDGIVNNTMRALLKDEYRTKQEQAGIGHKKKIGGREEVLLGAQEIKECVWTAAEKAVNTLPAKINESFIEADNIVRRNYELAEKDMEAVFQSRQERLKETVEYYSRRMLEDYSIPFDMETPVFEFEFPRDSIGNVKANIRVKLDDLKDMAARLENALRNAPLTRSASTLFGHLLNLLSLMALDEKDIPPMYYNADAFIMEYQNNFAYSLVADLSRERYEREYQSDLNRAVKVRRDYFDSIQKQMDEESRRMQNFAVRVYNMLDISGKLDMEKQRIEKQREDLKRVQGAVAGLQDGWGNVRPES
ncbi:MAG: GTPase domain-containing protein [Oscillibacter sp.]|nr:GTPase domain-containing protein [Oscillibacter sp.]